MKAFDIDIESLKESENITDEVELFKSKLVSELLKITSKMDLTTVLDKTGLHQSDYSRLVSMGMKDFTIDEVIGLIFNLGYTIDLSISSQK